MHVVSGGEETVHKTDRPILLVEDNLVNQKVALVLLERLGLTADVAVNGKEALAAVGKKNYAVILMDCHMPEMDGFEATVAIRKLEALAGTYTPIIAVTALAMVGDRERCIAAGMDDYIPKPIDKDLLKVKLNHWMRTDVVFKNQKLVRKYMRPNSSMTVLEGDPINLEELEEFYGSEQLIQMLTLFIRQTDDMLRRMEFFMKERNSKAVAGLAHELKASCASIGAKQLARLCLYQEQAVGQEDWIEAQETTASLIRSFEFLKDFVKPVINADEPAALS
jgi:CheY-like chemotaxis protein/HPt (histidine-containing phosphotransfer) domain-containing protein